MDIKASYKYYEGILEKPGVIPGKKTKVWCILDTKGMELIFYRENRRSSCIGSEDLSYVTAVNQLGAKSVGKDFEIRGLGGKTVIYTAESPEACEEWIRQISDVIGDGNQRQTDSSVEKKKRHPSASMQEVDDLLKKRERKHTSINDRIKQLQTAQPKTETEHFTGKRIVQDPKIVRSVSQENKNKKDNGQCKSTVEDEYNGNEGKLVNSNRTSASAPSVETEQDSECVSSAIPCENNMDDSNTKIKQDIVGTESEMKCETVNKQDKKIINGQNLNTQHSTNALSDFESEQTAKNEIDKNKQTADILPEEDEIKNLKNEKNVDDEPEEVVVLRSRFKPGQSYTEDKTAPKKETDTGISDNTSTEGTLYSTSQNEVSTSTEENKQTNDKDLEINSQDDNDEDEPVVMRRSKLTTSRSVTNETSSNSQATDGLNQAGLSKKKDEMDHCNNTEDEQEPVVLRRSNFRKMASGSKKSEEEDEDVIDDRYKTITKENCSIFLEKNQTDLDSDKEEFEVSLQFRSEEIDEQAKRDSQSTESVSTVDSDDGQLNDGLLTEEQENLLYSLTFDPIPSLPHSSSNAIDTSGFDELIDLCRSDLITNFDERRASSNESDDVIEQLRNLLNPV